MKRRTLWDALDEDRQWWRSTPLIVTGSALAIVLLGFGLFSVGGEGFGRLFVRLAVPLVMVAAVPLMRREANARVQRSLAPVPVGKGMAPESWSSMLDMALAAGCVDVSQLYLYDSDALNAFAVRDGRRIRITVSRAFTRLPKDEQRAGFAMLFGRLGSDLSKHVAGYELKVAQRKQKVTPAEDKELFSAWLAAAIEGDREALALLKDPNPLVCLLERLSQADTTVESRVMGSASLAAIGFLSWPYFSSWIGKVLPGAAGEDADGMPLKAAAALAAFFAAERAGSPGRPFGDPDLLRAEALRDVSGIEGAFAGTRNGGAAHAGPSRPAADAARSSATRAAIAGVALPVAAVAAAGMAPEVTVSVTTSVTHTAAAPSAAAAPEPAAATVPAPPSPAPAPAAASAAPRAPRVRIAVACPGCGADNVRTNRACIVCGHALPQTTPS